MLLDSLASRPTYIREIIPNFPTWTGAHNASGRGMGGVFAGPDGVPYLWSHPWTTTEAARLVTSSNPTGNLSIHDFQLAGNVAQLWLPLPKMAPLSAILNGSDNLTSIWWVRKGSTNTSTAAGSLLGLRSWLLRQHRVAAPTAFLALKKNHLADAASRRWDLSDTQLCAFFNRAFPQATSWAMLHLTPAQQHGLSTTFAKTRLPLASIPAALPPTEPTGTNGAFSALDSGSILPLPASTTQSPSSNSLPARSALATLPQTAGQFASGPWSNTFAPWPRSSPAWGPKIRATITSETLISDCPVSSGLTANKTPQPPVYAQSL
jgi:hypothetical protein